MGTARSSSTSRSATAARTTSRPTSRTTTCGSTRSTARERRRPEGGRRLHRRCCPGPGGTAPRPQSGPPRPRRRAAELPGNGAAPPHSPLRCRGAPAAAREGADAVRRRPPRVRRRDARRGRLVRGRDRPEGARGGARGAGGARRRDRCHGGHCMSTLLENALLPTYPPTRVTFVDGDGVWLTDNLGRRYLDFAAGIAVVVLGHKHHAPLAAAHRQLDRLWHASNLYGTEPAPALAQALSARFGGAQAFFCNSGAEANEAAIKYARKATGKPGVLALEQSFHGRTTGALAVTGQPAKRAAFEPLMPGARFAKPNDIASLRAAAGDDVGLVLLEPVLGEGGVIPLTPEFVQAAADLAEGLGALLAFAAFQSGIGRPG